MISVERYGEVLHIALNRPEKRNALNRLMCRQLVEAFHQPAKVFVLSGNGPSFCTGMDLSEDPETEVHEQLFTLIDRTRVPVIAAVHGAALAGGTGLVANAHIVIAAPDTIFGLPEIRIGLWPLLVFRSVSLAIGERRATEWSITGRRVEVAEAQTAGLVTEIAETPLDRALALANEVSGFSSSAMTEGLGYARSHSASDWNEAGKAAREIRERLMAGPDFQAATRKFTRG